MRGETVKLYYFAFPYTRDPKETTLVVQRRVLRILIVRKDIVPIIPHLAFAAIYSYPEGYSLSCVRDWEFEIIKRCDAFVYDPNVHSVGVMWELTIARGFNKPIYTYEQIFRGEDIE